MVENGENSGISCSYNAGGLPHNMWLGSGSEKTKNFSASPNMNQLQNNQVMMVAEISPPSNSNMYDPNSAPAFAQQYQM